MIRIEASTQVHQPREKVFGFLTDVERLPEWQTGVIQSQAISSGPVRTGYQFEESAKVGPWKLHTVCTVTDIKANERFAFEAKSDGPLDYEGKFELQPVAGGTRLTITGSARLKGVWRLLQPLLAGDLRKETRTELATIKRLVESASPVIGQPVANESWQP